jgi:hypothetical protein
MTGRQEYDRTKDRQRTLDKCMIDTVDIAEIGYRSGRYYLLGRPHSKPREPIRLKTERKLNYKLYVLVTFIFFISMEKIRPLLYKMVGRLLLYNITVLQ